MLRTRYGVIRKSDGKWLTSSDDYHKISDNHRNSQLYLVVEAKYTLSDVSDKYRGTRVPQRPFLREFPAEYVGRNLNCRCYAQPKEFKLEPGERVIAKQHQEDALKYMVDTIKDSGIRPFDRTIIAIMATKDRKMKPGDQVFSLLHGYGRITDYKPSSQTFSSRFGSATVTHYEDGKTTDSEKIIFLSKREAKEYLEKEFSYPTLTVAEIKEKAVHNKTIFIDSNGKEREFIGITQSGHIIAQFNHERPVTWSEQEIKENKWYIK